MQSSDFFIWFLTFQIGSHYVARWPQAPNHPPPVCKPQAQLPHPGELLFHVFFGKELFMILDINENEKLWVIKIHINFQVMKAKYYTEVYGHLINICNETCCYWSGFITIGLSAVGVPKIVPIPWKTSSSSNAWPRPFVSQAASREGINGQVHWAHTLWRQCWGACLSLNSEKNWKLHALGLPLSPVLFPQNSWLAAKLLFLGPISAHVPAPS